MPSDGRLPKGPIRRLPCRTGSSSPRQPLWSLPGRTVTVHGPAGDWSIFRPTNAIFRERRCPKNGPVPLPAEGDSPIFAAKSSSPRRIPSPPRKLGQSPVNGYAGYEQLHPPGFRGRPIRRQPRRSQHAEHDHGAGERQPDTIFHCNLIGRLKGTAHGVCLLQCLVWRTADGTRRVPTALIISSTSPSLCRPVCSCMVIRQTST